MIHCWTPEQTGITIPFQSHSDINNCESIFLTCPAVVHLSEMTQACCPDLYYFTSVAVCSMMICESICTHLMNGTTSLSFAQVSVYSAHGHGSVLLRWHCNTLCTSGYVDYIIFSHNETISGVMLAQHSSLTATLCTLKTLLYGIGCILS